MAALRGRLLYRRLLQQLGNLNITDNPGHRRSLPCTDYAYIWLQREDRSFAGNLCILPNLVRFVGRLGANETQPNISC